VLLTLTPNWSISASDRMSGCIWDCYTFVAVCRCQDKWQLLLWQFQLQLWQSNVLLAMRNIKRKESESGTYNQSVLVTARVSFMKQCPGGCHLSSEARGCADAIRRSTQEFRRRQMHCRCRLNLQRGKIFVYVLWTGYRFDGITSVSNELKFSYWTAIRDVMDMLRYARLWMPCETYVKSFDFVSVAHRVIN